MKYVIFSDVHSNYEALNTFLKLTDDSPDLIRICLGDIVGYGACPNECLDLIHERDIPVVMGNHEYALIEPVERHSFNMLAREAIEWQSKIIRPDNLEQIRKYPYTLKIDGQVSITHSNFRVPADFEYLFENEKAKYSFSSMKTQIGFFGHTHVPMFFTENKRMAADERISSQYVKGNLKEITLNPFLRYLINPGSIGQPRDGDSRASYVVLDIEAMTCCFHRVSYDYHSESKRIMDVNLPELLARRILTGQ